MSTVKADYLVNAAGTGAPTLTNGAVLPAGSASAPAISPTGDTNTGMFFPAADTVAVSTGGTERMRIDSSGNVGIGTTSPGVLLDVRNGSNTGGSGTWLTKVHQNTNTSGFNGLSVMNTWAASTSKVLELAVAWNGTTTGYYPIFQIDGINQRFSAIYGSGGSSAGATLYPEFQCRAWVNFNGTGTVAIRASGNVSSITDNNTGDYTVNFTTAMPDANYAVTCSATGVAGLSGTNLTAGPVQSTQAVGSIQVTVRNPTSRTDADIVSVAIFR